MEEVVENIPLSLLREAGKLVVLTAASTVGMMVGITVFFALYSKAEDVLTAHCTKK
ncbi:MAG TPA: hypothetical protein PKW49_01060 [Paludibacteraceae bacterium]|nr:hypothetical protein [Paludibacteraceae bacterium]